MPTQKTSTPKSSGGRKKSAKLPEIAVSSQSGLSSDNTENDSPEKKTQPKKLLFTVIFFYEWCKSCGICTALCPQKIIVQDETGKPSIDDMDSCTGCRFCEAHCPDFAITVKDRYPERRKIADDSE